MAAFASFTMNDGKATPVLHTFSPASIVDGVAKWTDRSGGIAIGYPAVTMSMRTPSKASKNYKVIAKIVVPVMEVVSNATYTGIAPAPTKAYDMIFNAEWVLPERSTAGDRADLLAYARNFLSGNGSLSSAVNNFEDIF